jgi:hypothetical protein
MNKTTADRYERIGAILAQIALQKKISPLERLVIDELHESDRSFRKAIGLLKLLRSSEDVLSISEIAVKLITHEETATAMLRSLKNGGFELAESQENIDTGGRILLFSWKPKDNALTYLLESLAEIATIR